MRFLCALLLAILWLPTPPASATERFVELDLQTRESWQAASATGARALACRAGSGPGVWLVDDAAAAALAEQGFVPRSVLGTLSSWRAAETRNRKRARARSSDFYADYADLAAIENRIDSLIAGAPQRAHRLELGESHEGRTIVGVELRGTAAGERPAILLNGTQHAREWIASMAPLFVLEQLIAEVDVDDDVTALLDAVDVFIVPVVNPDGFAHSHDPDGDRMWRKNRRVFSGTSCVGVDLNRNWGTDWNGGESTSTSRCSDLHVGPSPHSEPETAALKALVESIPNLVGHIDFHNYSQLILQPWGYTNDLPENFGEIDALGAAMGDAMEAVHGMDYPNYSGDGGLYLASGIFPDWTTAEHGALGYTVELRPVLPWPGFLLPPEEIRPTSEEAYEGVLEMLRWAAGSCGDDVVQPGESCDDGNLISGDGCDETCTQECGENCVAPCGDLSRPKLVVSRLDRAPGSQRLSLKASADLPAGGFAPASSALSVRVEGNAGAVLLDQTLGTASWDPAQRRGWKTNRKGTRWQWQDRGAGGIDRLTLSERRGALQLSLQIKSADLADATPPVQVRLSTADGEICAETQFTAQDCVAVRAGAILRCR